ncbi:MAG: DUF1441 family protein [Proteobacteria bacterium]|nr:DUF1441 family protein [Pseudomonadota bacterium]
MTTPATPVDAPPRAVMWTVSQVAERDRVSRQAVSKHVRRLADEHGLSVERDQQGRITSLNVAHYDSLRGRYADPSKAQVQTPRLAVEPNESYDEALRQKTWLEAERRRIELEALKKNLIEVDRVVDALGVAADEIRRVLGRLPNLADDLAAAVTRDGIHGLRVALGQHGTRLGDEVADALAQAVRRDKGEPTEDR